MILKTTLYRLQINKFRHNTRRQTGSNRPHWYKLKSDGFFKMYQSTKNKNLINFAISVLLWLTPKIIFLKD